MTAGVAERTLSEVADAIVASWGPDTQYATEEQPSRKPGDRSRGQCGTTALVVQDWLGGEILAATVSRDGESVGAHYWNRLPDGTEVDLTGGQFLATETLSEQRVAPSRPPDSEFQAHRGFIPYLLLSQRVRALLAPPDLSG
jgi:hypothetical protein